jgi:putative tryptophan/tyrosine transport system substrate-binding protein
MRTIPIERRIHHPHLIKVNEPMVLRRHVLALGAASAGLLRTDGMSVDVPRKVVYLGYDTPAQDAGFSALQQSLRHMAPSHGVRLHLQHHLIPTTPETAQRSAVQAAMALGCEVLVAPDAASAGIAAAALRQPAPAARQALVFSSFANPVAMGIVASMQAPGGRATGISLFDTWHGKRLELLREAFPGVHRVGVLLDRFWEPTATFAALIDAPAAALGLAALRFDADTPQELDAVMHSPAAARMDAWYVADSYIADLAEAQVIAHLARLQRPAIHTTVNEVAKGGALMAYAADRGFVFDALADLTLRVLRGEDPGGIPIQRPRRFVLAVRPREQPFALRIDPSVVRRADRIF